MGTTNGVVYNGSTLGLPNLVESETLGWGDAPDDTILFTVSEGGNYALDFRVERIEAPDADCAAVVQERMGAEFYDESGCPSPGETTQIDPNTTVQFYQWISNQQIMIWVSCSRGSAAQTVSYRLNILLGD